MQNPVIVDEQNVYDAWIAEQQKIALANQTPEGLGQQLTVKNGCVGCHSVDGAKLTGPTWFGLYSSEVPLADGTTVVADDAYISESIHDSNAKIVAGFPSPSVMPQYVLTDEEIANIIEYIKTLK